MRGTGDFHDTQHLYIAVTVLRVVARASVKQPKTFVIATLSLAGSPMGGFTIMSVLLLLLPPISQFWWHVDPFVRNSGGVRKLGAIGYSKCISGVS